MVYVSHSKHITDKLMGKISVALCTYNGAKYLRQQLDSILNQSCQPDEIVIVDDSSTDNTVEILRE